MRDPELKWVRHELTVPDSSPLMSLMIGDRADPALAGGRLMIDVPDMSPWPTSADKARILLRKAAEVEHALMIQYLYAAYSLKSPKPPDVTDPQQQNALRNWRLTVAEIAREEMGHLMTVQNLLLFLGLDPTFERADFPVLKGLFPFDTHLRRLKQETLAKYVVAESPTTAKGIEDIVKLAMGHGGMMVNRVGLLYALIGVVLAKDISDIEKDAAGGDPWYAMVQQVAYQAYALYPPSSSWHLPDEAFQPGSAARQGTQADWAPGNANVRIFALQSRQDAKAAIKDIGLQGEGPGKADDTTSHFARFLAMYRGKDAIPAYPAAGGWEPTLDVPTDPKISDDPSDPAAIRNTATQPWARLADRRYALLLGFLEEYLLIDPLAPRAFLKDTALIEMTNNLRRLSMKLVAMDRAEAGGGKAALPFGLPTAGFPLPKDPADRRQVHAGRLREAIVLEGQILASVGGTDDLLQGMAKQDQQTLTHFT